MEGVKPILEVQQLRTSFFTDEGEIKAVDGISFQLQKGKTLGIVGESGSGKSITSLSIMRLIQQPGKIVGGDILFNGKNLLEKSEAQMRELRGNQLSIIFQEPMTSLNPVYTVGMQIAEVFQVHQGLRKKQARQKAVEMLRMVGIPSPEKRLNQYPFELSGGMRQRVMVAIALACTPALLIADEPTTALDVTIQAQILDLINDLQQRLQMSVLMITHDLGVVAETCDDVAVMYCGEIVEYADVRTLFRAPKHPYTIGLLQSLPRHDVDQEELQAINGTVPSAAEMPMGCRFAPRCSHARSICYERHPTFTRQDKKNQVRCWMYSEVWDGVQEVDGNDEQRPVGS